MDFLGGDSRFVSSTTVEKHQISKVKEKIVDKIYPIREEFQWRPSSILCKRFDLVDPFMRNVLSLFRSHPPLPRTRSKFDALVFISDSGPEKKIEGANTALNRLVAGDFLESLGKELGLEVPPDRPCPMNKTNSFSSLTEITNKTDIKTSSRNGKSASTLEISYTHLVNEKISNSLNISRLNLASGKEASPADWDLPNHTETVRRDESVTPIRREAEGNFSDHKGDIFKSKKREKKEHRSRKHRSHSWRHRHSSASDTDSSSRRGYYDRSKSRSEKRSSLKRKSRKHSDNLSRKRSRSPTRHSSGDKDRDLSVDGRKHSRDRDKHSRKRLH